MTDQSRRRFDDDAADAAIDRAIREIMSTDVAPGFRQRVLARLDDHPRAAWAWGRLGLAAGAAAIVVVLAMWMRTHPTTDVPAPITQPAVAEQRADRPPPSSAPSATPAPPTQRPQPRAVARRSSPPPSERRVTAASIAAAEEALERGAPPSARPSDGADVAPLEIRSLEVPEIVVKPMTIGPIVLVPLPPPRR